MAVITNITTGEQSVSATGAVTGSLDTSALTGNYTIRARASGLTGAQTAVVSIEDTANATPFTDSVPIGVFPHFTSMPVEGTSQTLIWHDISAARFGATLTKFRANCTQITAGATMKLLVWLEQ